MNKLFGLVLMIIPFLFVVGILLSAFGFNQFIHMIAGAVIVIGLTTLFSYGWVLFFDK